jgi:hypothetical protein
MAGIAAIECGRVMLWILRASLLVTLLTQSVHGVDVPGRRLPPVVWGIDE